MSNGKTEDPGIILETDVEVMLGRAAVMMYGQERLYF